ncbi:MAG TPA: winged helix DNA-binding domain-containing protein [Anaeromyxobacteraceae bacterium]
MHPGPKLALQRLVHQRIATPTRASPAAAVSRLLAVQAQDYLGALWAVGLRTSGATERAVERALAAREIVRTWALRGTIHLVAAADLRWLLELLAPREVQRAAGRRAQLRLDGATIAKSARIVARALRGGKQLKRNDLYALLEQAGIACASSRGLHILRHLAQDGVVCFGAREGKQPTFALLEEWVPWARSLPRDEALGMLALRYFAGHGPATSQDLAWWSGLGLREARTGLAAVASRLEREVIAGQAYHWTGQGAAPRPRRGDAFLLPPFDEFLMGYRDRGAALAAEHAGLVSPGGNGIFHPVVVLGGRVAGTWRRTIGKDGVAMTFTPFLPFTDRQRAAVATAAGRYGKFLGAGVRVASAR